MVFQPGQAYNPNGRPLGSRNKRTEEVNRRCREARHKDPIFALSETISNTQDEGLRISAAAALAPYMHSKMQSTPTPRYIENPIELEDPQTIDQANTQIAMLGTLLAKGEIDLDFQQALIASRRAWIESKTSTEIEARVLALEQATAIKPEGDR
jgi:hypothetical protein